MNFLTKLRRFSKEYQDENSSPLVNMFVEILKQSDSSVPGLNENVIEDGLQQIAGSRGSILCPQINAVYMGLGKLIEKDWGEMEDVVLVPAGF
jgi:hypothetical protein